MNEGKCELLPLAPTPLGPLSVFHYPLMEVVGHRLDAHCDPLVVMRFIVTVILLVLMAKFIHSMQAFERHNLHYCHTTRLCILHSGIVPLMSNFERVGCK